MTGLYSGVYGPHGLEYVFVEQDGYLVKGTKVTGDSNVPRGKITFEVALDAYLSYGVGRIQLADTNFQNPRFGRCILNFDSLPTFEIIWIHCADETVSYDEITAESLRDIGPVSAFRTRFVKEEQLHRHQLEEAINSLPKDDLGNVDKGALEDRLNGII